MVEAFRPLRSLVGHCTITDGIASDARLPDTSAMPFNAPRVNAHSGEVLSCVTHTSSICFVAEATRDQ
jgi:hypothetical protein